MKEFKFAILGMMLIYLLFISYNLILYVGNMNKTISLSKNESYETQMAENKNIMEKLSTTDESKECLSAIKNMYDYSLTTYEVTEIKVTDFFKKNRNFEDNSLITYYSDIYNKCPFTEEEKRIPTSNVLQVETQLDTLFYKELFNYELSLKDIYMRTLSEPSVMVISYNARKNIESNTINYLLNLLEGYYE